MSDVNEKEIEIELELEEAPAKSEPEVKVERAEEAPANELSVEDGIKELKLKLEEERLARADAEKRAREASEQVNKAKSDVDDTNMQLINTAIDTVKRDNALLKQRMKEAMQNGDFDQVADYQEVMATNAAKLMQLENGKVAMENRPKQEYQPTYNDPVEAFASQLSAKSAAWVRKNPDYVTDPKLNRKMIAAHELAMTEDIKPDTPEYFDFIESTLRINKRIDSDEESPMSAAAAPAKKRSAAPAAAPVSRSATGTGTSNPNVVRLTAAEREMAQMMGMTDKEYAINKLELIKAGRMQ